MEQQTDEEEDEGTVETMSPALSPVHHHMTKGFAAS